MEVIDRYAYSNAIRQLDPAQKGALALLALLLCLTLDHPLVSILTVIWMLGLTLLWARIPPAVTGRVVLAQGLFLAVSALGVAISATLGAEPVDGWALRLGPLWLSSSPAALAAGLKLVARALGCAAALNFLILSTPLVDLIELLRRLRVPEALIDLMTLIYRAIFVLLESMQRMLTAQEARLGYSSPRRAMHSSAQLASQLFLDAYRRSQRLQCSLESRGMEGALRVLPMIYTRNAWPWGLGAAMAASLLLARLSR
ncbi:MAG: cobalt ECF transporter T component CbiQ [Oscillochloris sp.]|nr:cobalt ECF transporter T component CbiQ [Oscillochloris sp.]